MTYTGNAKSAQCALDVQRAYDSLAIAIPTNFPTSSILGNGTTLTAGTYFIPSAATLKATLTLSGNSNSVFIFQIQGPLSTDTSSKIKLINGVLACNVFWKVEGLVDMAPGTTMRGTIIANNAAIKMAAGDTLEGRALSTAGAVSVSKTMVYLPTGCGSPVLNGPTAPTLGGAACYGLFSSTGAVTNSGTTYVTGDVGSNSSSPTGFNPAFVIGTIHTIPDASTAQCAADLLIAFNNVDTLTYDIELLFPAELGHSLVLTPHVYLLNAATVLTDSLYLDAKGNINAVFIFKIYGALSTSVQSRIKLINGAQSKNVYWKIEGAVGIDNFSIFRGTIICHNGALGAINTGVVLDGRALTTTGALTTTADNVVATMIPANCASLSIKSLDAIHDAATIYPNPFNTSINISLNNIQHSNKAEFRLYNILGVEMVNTVLSKKLSTLEVTNFPAGVYFYKIIENNKTIQSGRLISQQ